jgi:hypothetical protein
MHDQAGSVLAKLLQFEQDAQAHREKFVAISEKAGYYDRLVCLSWLSPPSVEFSRSVVAGRV